MKNAKTATARKHLETKYGVKYSPLVELSYFDPIRFCIIDPMHNLFLGTAKTVLKDVWVQNDILRGNAMNVIQSRVEKLKLPGSCGRLPKKIASGFAEFTAEQWKNWTCIYSLYALRDLLPLEHFKCWEQFVLACRILVQPYISHADINKADLLLLNFCKRIQNLMGAKCIKPNMHFQCHLAECIRDFGPIHVFWLFAFERCNGMLGSLPTNQKSIEIQLMESFSLESHLYRMLSTAPSFLPEGICEKILKITRVHSNNFSILPDHYLVATRQHQARLDIQNILQLDDIYNSMISSSKKIRVLTRGEKINLLSAYRFLFPGQCAGDTEQPSIVESYNYVHISGETYAHSSCAKFCRSSYVLCSWTDESGNVDLSAPLRPGCIKSIFEYRLKLRESGQSATPKNITLKLAKVHWFAESSVLPVDHFGPGLPLWSREMAWEDNRPGNFVPLLCISRKFVPATTM